MRGSCLCLISSTLLFATSGCAFGPQLRRVAVDHNQLVANSNNELVLLNILRARDREPLHFTSVSKLIGDASIQGTAGSNIVVKGGTDTVRTNAAGELVDTATLAGTEITTPSAQLVIGGKSSMDVAIWDTQEFYQGITTSVPAGTLAHYLHQGWPGDLMTYLFVRSIDFVASEPGDGFAKGEIVHRIMNDPEDAVSRDEFGAFVSCYRLDDIHKAGVDTRLAPLAAVDDLKLADLAVLDGEKFDVDKDKDDVGAPVVERWVKRKGRGGDALALVPAPGCNLRQHHLKSGFLQHPDRTGSRFQGFSAGEQSTIATGTYTHAGKSIRVDVQVVLRSIEGVIYFLGEYARAPNPPYLVSSNIGPVPILRLRMTRPPDVFVATRFKGDRYYVPAHRGGAMTLEAGRSTQVFTLVQQLINLQKSVKDRPTTQTVRVVQ